MSRSSEASSILSTIIREQVLRPTALADENLNGFNCRHRLRSRYRRILRTCYTSQDCHRNRLRGILSACPHLCNRTNLLALFQGRAGLVAFRRYRGGANALGRPFYKGGFEPKMTRREATLILSLS